MQDNKQDKGNDANRERASREWTRSRFAEHRRSVVLKPLSVVSRAGSARSPFVVFLVVVVVGIILLNSSG